MAAKNERDFPACVTTAVLNSSFETAQEVISNRGTSIPAVSVDLSSCLPFQKDRPRAVLEEQVAAIIDSAASIPLSTIETHVRYSPAPDAKCEDTVLLAGTLAYLQGLSGPVLDELVAPDGSIHVPGVRLDFSKCAPSDPVGNSTTEERSAGGDSVAARLRQLRALLVQGLISQEEHDQRKAAILQDL